MYNKQTWANGDVIDQNKLNHMEDGLDAMQYVVVSTDDDDNFTYNALKRLLLDGKRVIVIEEYNVITQDVITQQMMLMTVGKTTNNLYYAVFIRATVIDNSDLDVSITPVIYANRNPDAKLAEY